jgi:hydroxylamine reductase (hybrid-cluster protein)
MQTAQKRERELPFAARVSDAPCTRCVALLLYVTNCLTASFSVLAAKSRCHLMTCKHQSGNGHIQRHDAVLKVIQNANNAGGRAYVQVRDLSDTKRLRPDLECAIGDKNLLADVQVIHPATNSRLRQPNPTVSAARDKTAKYSSLVGEHKAHSQFVPLIFEAYGGFGKSARDFCSRVSEQAVASGFSSRRAVLSLVSRVAIAIQRGNARTVLLSLRNCARLD